MEYDVAHYVTVLELKRQDRIMREQLDNFRREAIHLDSALFAAREKHSADLSRDEIRIERYKTLVASLKAALVRANSRLVVKREAVA